MKTFIILSVLLSSQLVTAQIDRKGNGGNTVVCKDNSGNILSAEILDLYEGRILHNLQYKEDPAPYPDQARSIIEKLAKTHGQGSTVAGGFLDLLARTERGLIFLPPGTGLKPIPDSEEFILAKGCELIQTASFRGANHIYIDSDIWNELSETQKAALLVHETIYWSLRSPGSTGQSAEVNSVRTRRSVALLFAGVALESLTYDSAKPGMKRVFCFTAKAFEDGRKATYFYAVPQTDGRIEFQFVGILDRNLITRATSTSIRPYDLSRWPLSIDDQQFFSQGKLSSRVDADIYTSIQWWPLSPENNEIFVRDGEGNSSWEHFVCE